MSVNLICRCGVGSRNSDRAHTEGTRHACWDLFTVNQKMTAQTSWYSLWKPSLQTRTELLRYQKQRWIPLQTCSLFFTVGLCLCIQLARQTHLYIVASDIRPRLSVHSVLIASFCTDEAILFFHIAAVEWFQQRSVNITRFIVLSFFFSPRDQTLRLVC